ncbi:MAG: hypothetical protein M1832_004913 [Thelocarpon impressellum]|nr:MAG: hypothetical protein M1832_004913 [Thelocarpon impressellum]
MSSSLFLSQEHTIPGQHIREYPQATANAQEDVLYLRIKQYRPLDNLEARRGDVTIIAAHANGFPKACSQELYEPLWDDLLLRSAKEAFRIRAIWIADVSHQGHSGVLNELSQGDDPSWLDHSRDLLHMVNHFREQMPRPLVGIGHSMGAAQLAKLSLMHPRLLSSLVLLEPVLLAAGGLAPGPTAQQSAFRRDIWPSRAAAEASFRKSAFYQAWDARVFDKWVQHGLRVLPTPIHPDGPPGSVTLTTPTLQEVRTFVRPNFHGLSPSGQRVHDAAAAPDLDLASPIFEPFYRPEPGAIFAQLPQLRPRVLFVFGATSVVCSAAARDALLRTTGTGVGGGGARVQHAVVPGTSHLVPLEAVAACADAAAAFLGGELARFRAGEERFEAEWTAKAWRDKAVLSAEVLEKLGGDPRRGRGKL